MTQPRPFTGQRRARRLAAKLGGAAAIRVDDAPASGTRQVSGSKYFVVQEGGPAAVYWPVTEPGKQRVFELRADADGNVRGVQVAGPDVIDTEPDTWESFQAKLRDLVEPHE